MAKVSEKDQQRRSVISAEDFSAEVEELMRYAEERGRAGHQPQRPSRGPAPVRTVSPEKPDITDLLRQELVSALEDEVLPAVTPGPDHGIHDWELQRELAKKALVGLKLAKLKELASEMRLDKRGRSEDIAERIARAYRYDERQIAQLIVENEEEPEPDRGHVERIFPLAALPDTAEIALQLQPIIGRYVRVGVARWFVFEDLTLLPGRMMLAGTLRSYRTFVTNEPSNVDDEDGAVPLAHISASPSETSVQIEIREGSRTVRVRGAGAAPARAAASALEVATQCRRLGYLPFAAASFEGPLGAFARSTIFMLDFIDSRLAATAVSDRNLTVARFEMDTVDAAEHSREGTRPTLREVRFEGEHLLDSATACRLIALEGRALIDLSLRVSAADSGGEPVRFPIRLALERDHALVITGFGRHAPDTSAGLHQELVRAVERSLDAGPASTPKLESLARRIDDLARSNRDLDTATMLQDENDEDHDGNGDVG
jgi:hypothetical protein